MPSFWDYFIPQSQANIEGGKTAADEGNPEWAEQHYKSAQNLLEQAKDQTNRQIAERNAGSYDPNQYDENGAECSKFNPRHPAYQEEDRTSAAERRAAHRRNLEEMDDW
jgi:hypothetical protein